MNTPVIENAMEFSRLYLDGEIKADGNRGRMAIKADKPTYREIKDDQGRIVDYQDVKIEGHGNTFNLDRGKDQVIPGSFVQHLQEYLTNPLLLVDHVRDTEFAAGTVKTAYEDEIGLKITAVLSNSPSEKMKDIRFKVAEGVLRALSIGGKFFGQQMGEIFVINKIELREISIVTVPMNKESLFEVKEESENACACDADHEKIDLTQEAQAEDETLILVDDKGEQYQITQEEN
jgi:HK97 family phage prohead protease